MFLVTHMLLCLLIITVYGYGAALCRCALHVNAVVNSVLQIVGYVLISICWFLDQVFTS